MPETTFGAELRRLRAEATATPQGCVGMTAQRLLALFELLGVDTQPFLWLLWNATAFPFRSFEDATNRLFDDVAHGMIDLPLEGEWDDHTDAFEV
jgi:hypothetical protein